MSARIFLCYRREETYWFARTLCDRLGTHFGKEHVFMDVDTIAPGDDFTETINRTLKECEVVIAIIGKTWLTAQDSAGRRLNNPDDLVRLELTTALKRNVTVIPVLAQGATMPLSSELPTPLTPLAQRNATTISETHYESDIKALIQSLEKALNRKASQGEAPNPEKDDKKNGPTVAAVWPSDLGLSNPFTTIEREPSIWRRWLDGLDDFWFSYRNRAGWTMILVAAAIAPFFPHAESPLLRGPKGLLFSDDASGLEWCIFALLVLLPLGALLGKICQLLNRHLIRPYGFGQHLTVLALNFTLFIVMFLFLFGNNLWFPGWLYAIISAIGALMLDPY